MFARGEKAVGHCDRCGWKYKLKDLRKEWSGNKVCANCWDPKPQDFPPNPRVRDPQALRDPRPDHDDVDPPESQLKDHLPDNTFHSESP